MDANTVGQKRVAAAEEEEKVESKRHQSGNPILDQAHCDVCTLLMYSRSVLPCAHACCSECMAQLLAKSPGQIRCPHCRADHHLQKVPSPDLVFRALLEHAIESDASQDLKDQWRERKQEQKQKHFRRLVEYAGASFLHYVGDLGQHGKPDGQGVAKFFSHYVYTGQWKEGLRDGQGEFKRPDGIISYTGQWKAGKREGQGTEKCLDGSVYKGQWKEDKYEGQGELRMPDGGIYTGQLKAGRREGQGMQKFPSGIIYTGQWKANMADGQGEFKRPNGSICYTGQWKANKREGQGTGECSNGSVYEGQWKADMQHGKGKATSADGSVYEGSWKCGKREL